ncbi:MAG: M23 family metallopeptidase [Chloroflexi bacterium]|nr:M23 family metallopeptidase [Chloroflexota bacterium]
MNTSNSPNFQPEQKVYAQTHINLRRSPGYLNKTASDILLRVVPGTGLIVLQGPQKVDNLVWWQVRASKANGEEIEGWVASATARGRRLIDTTTPEQERTPLPLRPKATFRQGETVTRVAPGTIPLHVASTNGGRLEPQPQLVLPSAGPFTILDGPLYEDDLYWWRLRCPLPNGEVIEGWAPEATSKGVRVLIPTSTPIPITIRKPFQGLFAVTQPFAANPDFYRQFTYDGVPLRGHNGLDFGMPVGTKIHAVAEGVVAKVGEDPAGFGRYVLLRHSWGESLYAHLRFISVQYQQNVQENDLVGLSGNSGASIGPHLHFGIRLHPYRRDDGWGGFCYPAPFFSANDLISYRGDHWPPTPLGPEDAKLPRP